jgi:glutathione S-transferase
MLALYDDMEKVLGEHRFLVGDQYTTADAAFTP